MTVVLAVGASLALSAATEPRYTAKSVIGFNDESADLQVLGTPAAPNFQPDKLAAAQAERIARPDIVAEVRRRTRTTLTPTQIQNAISTQVEVASNLVSIAAEADNGQLAARLANGFAEAIRDDVRERAVQRYRSAASDARRRARRLRGTRNLARRAVYEDQASRLLALATFTRPVDVVRSAEVPDSPSSPKPVRNAVLAAILGLLLGIGIAFLRQTLDRRLREPGDVEEHLKAPVVGLLPSGVLGGTPMSTPKGATPSEADVEPFKILRTNVGYLSIDSDVKVILATSPLPAEGKSTVASGMAWAEAKNGNRTLLVDCDLRRPMLATRLGLEASPGLADYLVGKASPSDILRTVATGGDDGEESFVCIPAGRSLRNHAELLASDRFKTFLTQVSEVYDRIVLDSAPLLPVSDTLALLPYADAVLLCIRLSQTTRDEALAAKAALGHLPARPLGLVITAADTSHRPYYVGSYAYETTAAQGAT